MHAVNHAPREALEEQVRAAALGPRSARMLLLGPRGIGKTTLLHRLAARARAEGVAIPVLVDMERGGYSPEALLLHFFSALDREVFGGEGLVLVAGLPVRRPTPGPKAETLNRFGEILEREFRGSHPGTRRLLELLTRLPGEMAGALDRPLLLLLDEVQSLARLNSYPATRDYPPAFLRSLASHRRVRIVGTAPSYHPAEGLFAEALRGDLSPEIRTVPGLTAEEVAAAGGPQILAEIARDLSGRPSYLLALEEAHRATGEATLVRILETALREPDGPLYRECRLDYELGIERARGYGVTKSALAVLAREDGLNLTGVARYLKKSVASARDYLRWLEEVGLVRCEEKRYFHADRLLRLWTLLYAAGPAAAPPLRAGLIASFLGEVRGGDPFRRHRAPEAAAPPSRATIEAADERAREEAEHRPRAGVPRDPDLEFERAADEATRRAGPGAPSRRPREPRSTSPARPSRPRGPGEDLMEID